MDLLNSVLGTLENAREEGKTLLSILVDPDKAADDHLEKLVENSDNQSDIFFVGGSLVTELKLDQTIDGIKKRSNKPVVLFPGSLLQISNKADALLFLTLISGRNAELLIGHHVVAAPMIRKMNLEVMPVGYMLIDGGKPTTASYMSHTHPIPANKPEIAVCTAMAGEMLGLKLLYLDAGSGAENPVSADIISAVREHTDLPIIVGGGIRTPEQAARAAKAGATVIVIGNALEKDPSLIRELKKAISL